VSKRVNLTVSEEVYEQLTSLSHACNARPETLGDEMLQLCLNNADIVDYLQKRHNVPKKFRI
jgi:hypothetical protein